MDLFLSPLLWLFNNLPDRLRPFSFPGVIHFVFTVLTVPPITSSPLFQVSSTVRSHAYDTYRPLDSHLYKVPSRTSCKVDIFVICYITILTLVELLPTRDIRFRLQSSPIMFCPEGFVSLGLIKGVCYFQVNLHESGILVSSTLITLLRFTGVYSVAHRFKFTVKSTRSPYRIWKFLETYIITLNLKGIC